MRDGIIGNTHDKPPAIGRAAITMEWFHIVVKKLGIVQCKLFSLINITQRHHIQSIIFAVGIATMILWRPFSGIAIPDNEYFLADGISIPAEMLLFLLVPCLLYLSESYKSLGLLFSTENKLATPYVTYCIHAKPGNSIAFYFKQFLFAFVAVNAFGNDMP